LPAFDSTAEIRWDAHRASKPVASFTVAPITVTAVVQPETPSE
jgi:hypothetical protein